MEKNIEQAFSVVIIIIGINTITVKDVAITSTLYIFINYYYYLLLFIIINYYIIKNYK